MFKALHNGPWFIFNHFLSVHKWEPKYISSNTQLTYTTICLRLSELPTEFYNFEILQLEGEKIGTLLKVDTCTSATTKGRYARICIEIPLEMPLKTHVYTGTHRQQILYERLNMLCTLCGRLGHTKHFCSSICIPSSTPPQPLQTNNLNAAPTTSTSIPHATTSETNNQPITQTEE